MPPGCQQRATGLSARTQQTKVFASFFKKERQEKAILFEKRSKNFSLLGSRPLGDAHGRSCGGLAHGLHGAP